MNQFVTRTTKVLLARMEQSCRAEVAHLFETSTVHSISAVKGVTKAAASQL